MGMKQRLGIARAFLNRPELIILDEPTNGLDPMGIIEIRQIVRGLADEEKVSFLICSHILGEMEAMCDEIIIINKGNLMANGQIPALLSEQHCATLEQYYLEVLKRERRA